MQPQPGIHCQHLYTARIAGWQPHVFAVLQDLSPEYKYILYFSLAAVAILFFIVR